MITSSVIKVVGITKSYGDLNALCGIDVTVREGTVDALLGPNGAAKTTSVNILSTPLTHDEGDEVHTGRENLRPMADLALRGLCPRAGRVWRQPDRFVTFAVSVEWKRSWRHDRIGDWSSGETGFSAPRVSECGRRSDPSCC